MKELLWKILARALSWRPVASCLIAWSKRSPYFAIIKGETVYMDRWWLFNRYDYETRRPKHRWCPISIRVHHIRRPDDDRHLHDHPWNARTIILSGTYTEQVPRTMPGSRSLPARVGRMVRTRRAGDTAQLGPGQFHRIADVSEGGVYTLFITGPTRAGWGFLVDGVKVPWRDYLGVD